MDDMLFQCNNQNSVYVLDANYNSYQDFTPFNQIETSRVRNIDASSCSNISCNFQHKLKSFGNSVSASGLARPTAITSEANGCGNGNPVATSMSAAMCSPATSALQKLFNCSSNLSGGNGGGGGSGSGCNNISACHANQNVSHRSQNNLSSYYDKYTTTTNNNNNSNNNNNNNGTNNCMPTTERDMQRDAGALFAARVALNVGGIGSAGANKKKCANVKSTLIAKKTKFLKFLEEEKWRRNDDNSSENIYGSGNLQQQRQQQQEQQHVSSSIRAGKSNNATTASFAGNSSVQQSTMNALAKRGERLNNKNHVDDGQDDGDGDGVGGGCVGGVDRGAVRQNKLNNWSVNNDSNNQDQQSQQQQNKQTKFKQTQKSSYELYKEAADILGLSCTLCDNCRCLDCQSGYFDCDDSDSSDHSFMDDEFGDNGDNVILVNGQMTNMAMLMSMHANANELDDSVEDCYECADNWQGCHCNDGQFDCDGCNATIRHVDDEVDDCAQNEVTQTQCQPQQQQQHSFDAAVSVAYYNDECERIVADDVAVAAGDGAGAPATLITAATCSKIVENCENFNDLSLLDGKVKAPAGTLENKESCTGAI